MRRLSIPSWGLRRCKRSAAVLLFVVLAVNLPLLPVDADARGTRVASVEFTDTQPVTANLPDLLEQRKLRVQLTNLLDVSQPVILSVVGLAPRDDFTANRFSDGTATLEPRRSSVVEIPFNTPGSALNPAASYSGTIVAVGSEGPSVRLAFTLSKSAPSTTGSAETAAAPAPLPDTVTLAAMNFAPSMLSPLGPGLIVLGLIAVLIAWALWDSIGFGAPVLFAAGALTGLTGGLLGAFGERTLSAAANDMQGNLFAIAGLLTFIWILLVTLLWAGRRTVLVFGGLVIAALLGVGLIEARGADLENQRSAYLVATKPVPLPPGSVDGRVGTAASARGDVVRLEVPKLSPQDAKAKRPLELLPSGVKRAGAYDGKIDLNGAATGGETKVTVNARDWWLWAFLTLAVGVVLGYLVRRYFEHDRPKAKVGRDLELLWQEIAAAGSEFQRSAIGRPYEGLSMIHRARSHRREIERLLREDEAVKAASSVEALRKLVNTFATLRESAGGLYALYAELVAACQVQSFGLDLGDVDVLVTARRALENDEDPEDAEGGEASRTAAQKAINDAKTLVEAVLPVHADVARHLAAAVGLEASTVGRPAAEDDADPPVKPPATAEDFVKTFRVLGQTLLDAANTEAVAKVDSDDDAAWTKFLEFASARLSAGSLTVEAVGETPGLEVEDGAVVAVDAVPAARGAFAVAQQDMAIKLTSAHLRATVLGPERDVESWNGDADDLFEFLAEIDGIGAEPVKLRWRLGEQVAEQTAIPMDGSVKARLRHQFGGDADTVDVTMTGNDVPPITKQVRLRRPGRAESLASAFGVRDLEMTLIAGMLAVGSGMLVQYFAGEVWGLPKDYLAAVLWGGVTAESIKVLSSLVSKVWSA